MRARTVNTARADVDQSANTGLPALLNDVAGAKLVGLKPVITDAHLDRVAAFVPCERFVDGVIVGGIVLLTAAPIDVSQATNDQLRKGRPGTRLGHAAISNLSRPTGSAYGE